MKYSNAIFNFEISGSSFKYSNSFSVSLSLYSGKVFKISVIKSLITYLESVSLDGIALITLVDDAKFVYESKQLVH